MSKQAATTIKYVLGVLCILASAFLPEYADALRTTAAGLIGWGTPRLGKAS